MQHSLRHIIEASGHFSVRDLAQLKQRKNRGAGLQQLFGCLVFCVQLVKSNAAPVARRQSIEGIFGTSSVIQRTTRRVEELRDLADCTAAWNMPSLKNAAS